MKDENGCSRTPRSLAHHYPELQVPGAGSHPAPARKGSPLRSDCQAPRRPLRALKGAGKSPKTIRNIRAVLAAALHQRVRWGWLKQNPADIAKPPRVPHQKVHAPTTETVKKVIEAAEDRDPRLALLLMLAALTGMRRGELCALRWSDVELGARCHHRLPLSHRRHRRADREVDQDRPCSEGCPRSRRRLPVGGSPEPGTRVGGGSGSDAPRRCLRLLPLRGGDDSLPSGQRDQLLHPGPQRRRCSRRPVARPPTLHGDAV